MDKIEYKSRQDIPLLENATNNALKRWMTGQETLTRANWLDNPIERRVRF